MELSLSIVVPTLGRCRLVADLLESIREDAGRAGGRVEILLIDDSPEAEADQIRAAAEKFGAIYVASPTANICGKRNLGASLANYACVLFLDSDVTVRPGLLRAHFERLSSAPDDVVGCLGKVKFSGAETFAYAVIHSMQLSLPFSYPDHFEFVPWGPTANLSVKRAAFELVGGFDESLTRYAGEDVDLGFRWLREGLRIMTAPDAVAFHTTETWSRWRDNFPRLWSYGIADYQLIARYPERSFIDFPPAPIIWVAQLALTAVLVAMSALPLSIGGAAMVASFVAYLAVYTLRKRQPGERWTVHIVGPVVFWTMDAAKAVEAGKRGRFDIILKRLLFLDDLIAQDWREIVASAWGISASAIAFAGVILLGGG